MSQTIAAHLKRLGIVLPQVPVPVANYVPFTLCGSTLYISGQIPVENGEVKYKGLLGKDITREEGYAAARLCALNILAQASAALDGNLDRITRCARLGGFVASTPDYTDHPKVVNGASDFIVDILGDAGRHARAAVGVSSLPLGVCVEVEAIFEIGG